MKGELEKAIVAVVALENEIFQSTNNQHLVNLADGIRQTLISLLEEE